MNEIILNPEYANLIKQITQLKNDIADLYQEKDELLYHICKNIEAEYMSKIGMLEYKLYEYYCEILRLKRKIELYQTCINRQEEINKEEIEQKLEEEYKKYEEQLKKMSEDLTKSLERKNGNVLSEEDSNEIKRIHRKLIKKLHPDLNKNATPKDIAILTQVTKAYENGDLETLKNLELAISEITEKEEVEIGELEELRKSKESYIKIVEQLLESLKKIKESFPYNKKEFLKSKILVDKKVEELKAEMEEYRNIYAQLEEIFKGLEGENNGWFG